MRISIAEARQLGLDVTVETEPAPRRQRRPDAKVSNDLVSACLALLKLHGIHAWRNNTTGVFDPERKVFRTFAGRKGVSDILGVIPPSGRLLAVECKSGNGKLTVEQKAFLHDVTSAGGVAVCARSLDDLRAALHDAGVGGA